MRGGTARSNNLEDIDKSEDFFLTVLSFIFVAYNNKTYWVLKAIFGVIYLTTTKFYSRKVYDVFCPIW